MLVSTLSRSTLNLAHDTILTWILRSAAEMATLIIAATFPTMPRSWVFVRTGDRNALSTNKRSAPPYSTSRKQRRPIQLEPSRWAGDTATLNGGYKELRTGKNKVRREEDLELQILKAETYKVTSYMKKPAETYHFGKPRRSWAEKHDSASKLNGSPEIASEIRDRTCIGQAI